MAKAKLLLRPYVNSDGEQAVNVRISHKGKNKFISTGVSIKKKYWSKEAVKKSHHQWLELNSHLKDFKDKYEDRILELESQGGDYSVDDVVNIGEGSKNQDFIQYGEDRYLKKFEDQGKYNSHKRIKSVIKKLKIYTKGRLRFKDLTVKFLNDYDNYLLSLGNNRNTANANLKVIRTILYQAIREGYFDRSDNPFFNFQIKEAKVEKDKLTARQIKKIIESKVSESTLEIHAKNYFLLSYYLAGMRFGDLATLKGENLDDHIITYTMNKTGRRMQLKLDPESQTELFEILEFYKVWSKKSSEYLFPILENGLKTETELKKEISSANAKFNSSLDNVMTKAEIPGNIGFHIARHTFADISRKKGIDLYDISKLLGHSSIKQTENYLASLDTDSMNKAFKRAYE